MGLCVLGSSTLVLLGSSTLVLLGSSALVLLGSLGLEPLSLRLWSAGVDLKSRGVLRGGHRSLFFVLWALCIAPLLMRRNQPLFLIRG